MKNWIIDCNFNNKYFYLDNNDNILEMIEILSKKLCDFCQNSNI